MASAFKRQFVALAAPSGGGKSTLCGMLLKKYSSLALSISFTTRAPRGSERNGVEYHFVSRPEFESLIRKGELIEWAEVHGNYYGTSKPFLESQISNGKVVLLDIDVQGVQSLRAEFGERCLCIFIQPPDMETLEKRLRIRSTEAEEKIQQRLKNAVEEMAQAKDFDYQLINDQLDNTFKELCGVLEKEVGLV